MKNNKDKILIMILSIIVVLSLLNLALFFSYKNPVGKYKPYYITRDENGTVWIGDKPGQKQERYCTCKYE